MNFFRSTVLMLLICSMTTSAAFASENGAVKDYVSDSVYQLQADKPSKSFSGKGNSTQKTDTRTPEQKAADQKKEEAQKIQNKINEVLEKMQGQTTGTTITNPDGSKWDWGNLGDWVNSNGGSLGTVTLPDWVIGNNPTLSPSLEGAKLPTINDLWKQFIEKYPEITNKNPEFPNQVEIPNQTQNPNQSQLPNQQYPNVPITSIDNPSTVDKVDFTGTKTQATNDGLMIVSQFAAPIQIFAIGAATNAKLPASVQPNLSQPTSPKITVNDYGPNIQFPEPIIVETPKDIGPKITMTPFDYKSFFDSWAAWIRKMLPLLPGENSQVVENQFIRHPQISDLTNTFPGMLSPGKIPGTDISVVYPNNSEDLYNLLLFYMSQLQELNMTSTNVTKFTLFQLEKYDNNIIHTSIPTKHYRWLVTSPGGESSVEKNTDTPYAKLLFRGSGTYNVKVFNNQNVYRNNKVSGKKIEMYVISGGSFFDGLVVSKSSSTFEGYINEDVGPTLEEVELKKNGFTANVTDAMLNKIQVVDSKGNVMSPAEGFTTQRN